MQSIEALAHYTRGLATMFFVMWAFIIYRYRRHGSIMRVLLVAVCVLALGFVKDFLYVFDSLKNNPFVAEITTLFDVLCVPFVCAFFFEAVRPGIITRRRLAAAVLPFVLLLPLYGVWAHRCVLYFAYGLAFVMEVVTMVLVRRYMIRYNKCVEANYSYKLNVSVTWVYSCAIIYFVWFFGYILCFGEPTWWGEVFFDVGSIAVWSLFCGISGYHRVVPEMEPTPLQDGVGPNAGESETMDLPVDAVHSYLAERLRQQMEIEHLYLDPSLSLGTLALAVGSNKSYVSGFINRNGRTFYDFVNEFRVKHACRLLDQMPGAVHLNMQEVATQSGFNSLSSFNRYFSKMVGMTPTAYLKRSYSR